MEKKIVKYLFFLMYNKKTNKQMNKVNLQQVAKSFPLWLSTMGEGVFYFLITSINGFNQTDWKSDETKKTMSYEDDAGKVIETKFTVMTLLTSQKAVIEENEYQGKSIQVPVTQDDLRHYAECLDKSGKLLDDHKVDFILRVSNRIVLDADGNPQTYADRNGIDRIQVQSSFTHNYQPAKVKATNNKPVPTIG